MNGKFIESIKVLQIKLQMHYFTSQFEPKYSIQHLLNFLIFQQYIYWKCNQQQIKILSFQFIQIVNIIIGFHQILLNYNFDIQKLTISIIRQKEILIFLKRKHKLKYFMKLKLRILNGKCGQRFCGITTKKVKNLHELNNIFEYIKNCLERIKQLKMDGIYTFLEQNDIDIQQISNFFIVLNNRTILAVFHQQYFRIVSHQIYFFFITIFYYCFNISLLVYKITSYSIFTTQFLVKQSARFCAQFVSVIIIKAQLLITVSKAASLSINTIFIFHKVSTQLYFSFFKLILLFRSNIEKLCIILDLTSVKQAFR